MYLEDSIMQEFYVLIQVYNSVTNGCAFFYLCMFWRHDRLFSRSVTQICHHSLIERWYPKLSGCDTISHLHIIKSILCSHTRREIINIGLRLIILTLSRGAVNINMFLIDSSGGHRVSCFMLILFCFP